MPTYEYRCDAGHLITLVLPSSERDDRLNAPCLTADYNPDSDTYDWCELPVRRKFSPFRVGTIFEPHFNSSTGQYVNTRRELDEQNRIASAQRTERLGLETNFVAHDIRDLDPASMGVTDEGMDTTHDAQVAAGVKESKGRFVF